MLIVPSECGTFARALWCSHRPDPRANLAQPRRDGFLYWDNPYFRNESGLKSSDLILEAIAVTRCLWRDHLPPDGFHSFVDPRKLQPIKRRGVDFWGYCFHAAGFRAWHELTKARRLIRYVMPLEALMSIEPQAPHAEQLKMFA